MNDKIEDKDLSCPAFGIHRYYLAGKTYTDFTPTDTYDDDGQLYKRIEYAVISCQCGSVIRKEVENQ